MALTKGDKIGIGAVAVIAAGIIGYEIYVNTASGTTPASSASTAQATQSPAEATAQLAASALTTTTVQTQEGAATVYTQPSSVAVTSITSPLVVQPNGYVYGANPSGKTAVSTNYKAVVNANGGLYINHKWVAGSYGTGSTFIPS